MNANNATVRHDQQQQRYVLEVNGNELGVASYQQDGERQIFTHTEVDPSLEGQGMGSKLIRESLNDARQRGKRIVPQCEFVAAYVNKHDEWSDIVDMQ